MSEQYEYLTTTEFARRLRVSANAVKMWCAAGKLHACVKTPGGHWRIPASNFAALGAGVAMETAATYAVDSPLDDHAVEGVLRSIVNALVDGYRPEKIILFGSWAGGRPREDSDLDLLIIKRTRKPMLERMAEVDEIIRPIAPLVAMDAIVMTPSEVTARLRAGDRFVDRVVRSGRQLYAA